jgi:hypothetical protein
VHGCRQIVKKEAQREEARQKQYIRDDELLHMRNLIKNGADTGV